MKVVSCNVKLISPRVIVPEDIYNLIARTARVCYQSENKVSKLSSAEFVAMLIKRGHLSPLEFIDITIKCITDRGISHELVRHRLCSFMQESTRYCNYGGKDIEFVKPVGIDDPSDTYCEWMIAMENSENFYNLLLELGNTPQVARSVLPNSLKTEIYIKANLREWRHIFKLRRAKAAHPDMLDLMYKAYMCFAVHLPIIFEENEHD